ncbi:hypothetical protein SB768_29775 [Burkholderia sp. SIMBA_043]|uniref:Uncharacterized protein n=1 Tax=Burkholderia ubonensis TaxID=101571 RepID=A0A1B4LHU0_9BURK|nr:MULTISPECIES: hypothetical protein [Burkholderia cepacia complex]AJY08115.1 putative membrane protein [Burkholderia vietnamiensis LMG 10929]AOJ76678.1 hypothetical protein WJ35_16455 [Burkholderia ubonensis]AOK13766.1 hypothetical protein WK31_25910 [Burkholderia vietnamiensis]AVR14857.1 hypothetical protein A8H33_15805 [Burkholderia vietnamiensis]KVE66871.1 hypothetical protein WI96_10605 [Burkholderia vietnamiensis]
MRSFDSTDRFVANVFGAGAMTCAMTMMVGLLEMVWPTMNRISGWQRLALTTVVTVAFVTLVYAMATGLAYRTRKRSWLHRDSGARRAARQGRVVGIVAGLLMGNAFVLWWGSPLP